MADRHCETCKYWERYEKKERDFWLGEGWGKCKREGMDEDGGVKRLLHAQDAEDYGAWFETHQTFGCVQHIERVLSKQDD